MTKNPPTAAKPVAQAVHATIAGAVQAIMIHPRDIAPSPTNPRKSFPEDSLRELAASMQADGQVQAITVRRMSADSGMAWNKAHPGSENGPPMYELVVGERRWRAATMGDFELRAEVRELTDLQVVRIQIIENLHREEVHPLEEAEGYDYLLHKSGEGVTLDQIADEVGKSKSYVQKRMRLAALCPEARKAFYEGKFDASTALLVARQATPALQLSAIADIEDMTVGDDAPSYREILQMFRERYQLRLETAPFDIADANLVKGCGACGTCPKRTGNQAAIFDDVASPDVCTDPDCFAGKRKAHFEQVIKVERKAGTTILEGDAAKDAAPYGPNSYLKDHTPIDRIAFSEGDTDVTYADLLERAGKKAPKAALLVHPDHPDAAPRKLLTHQDAEALRVKYLPKAEKPKPNAQEQQDDAEQQATLRASRITSEYGRLLTQALRETATEPRTAADLVVLIFTLIGDEITEELLAAAGVVESGDEDEASNPDDEAALIEALFQKTGEQLGNIAFGLAVGSIEAGWGKGDLPIPVIERAVASHNLDIAALRQQAEAAIDAE